MFVRKKNMGGVSIFLLLTVLAFSEAQVCPRKEDMLPCECIFRFGANQVLCKDILSPEELIPPMRALAMVGTDVLSLTIDSSSLLYLPDNLFKNTIIERVYFENTEIMSLSESDIAFAGLEDTLQELRANDAKFVSHWDFDQLRNLKNLRLIDVHQMILGAVDHPFPLLPELTALGIISAEISFINDDAFTNLPKLTIFNMKDNDLTEMKRSMFPNPAEHLSIIDLSQNKLSSLPEDFFENMPQLSDVLLDKNNFITLPEKSFSLALRNLRQLSMSENPFRCDCRMQWLVNIRFPLYFKGECSSPESVKGRTLTHLDYRSLKC